jgi:hypothetical protein
MLVPDREFPQNFNGLFSWKVAAKDTGKIKFQ